MLQFAVYRFTGAPFEEEIVRHHHGGATVDFQ
jgi:hypothetical protein